jgi:hypothetical protein
MTENRLRMADNTLRVTRPPCHADRSGGISFRAGGRSFGRLRMTENWLRMIRHSVMPTGVEASLSELGRSFDRLRMTEIRLRMTVNRFKMTVNRFKITVYGVRDAEKL